MTFTVMAMGDGSYTVGYEFSARERLALGYTENDATWWAATAKSAADIGPLIQRCEAGVKKYLEKLGPSGAAGANEATLEAARRAAAEVIANGGI